MIIHIVHGGFWGGFFDFLDEKLCHNVFQLPNGWSKPKGGDICVRVDMDLDINGLIHDVFTMVNMIHDEKAHMGWKGWNMIMWNKN